MAECGRTSGEESRPVLINEVLFFVNSTIDQNAIAQIKTTVVGFYREDEIVAAKHTLIRAVEDMDFAVAIQQYTKKRIGENKLRANVDDIMNIFVTVDENMRRDNLPVFCAADRSRIPMFVDEMSDIAAIRLELSQLRQQVELLTNQLRCNNKTHETVNKESSPTVDTASPVMDEVLTRNSLSAVDDVGGTNDTNGDPGSQNTLPTFAHLASQITDADGFQTKTKKNKQKKKLIVGNSHVDNSLKGVVKKSVICVSRLATGTTTEVVIDYMKNRGVHVLSCYVLKPANTDTNTSLDVNDDTDSPVTHHPRFTSMRVCISQSHRSKIFDTNFWPYGVVVRPWVFKPLKTSSHERNAIGEEN